MSKYTTQVRFICETYAGLSESQGYPVANILQVAAPKVFTFSWPIFDENYRLPLEIKILRHYYTREICAETPGLWTLWLESKLNDIMPYYNQLYKSELIKIEPLTRLDWKETMDRDAGDQSTTTVDATDRNTSQGTTTNKVYGVSSDTPQNKTLSVTNEADYLSLPASQAQANKGDTTVDNTDTLKRDSDTTYHLTSTEDYTRHFTGNNASRTDSEMIKEFRETFLNIDMQVIEELSDLFLNVY